MHMTTQTCDTGKCLLSSLGRIESDMGGHQAIFSHKMRLPRAQATAASANLTKKKKIPKR